jgi:hypothetical protein
LALALADSFNYKISSRIRIDALTHGIVSRLSKVIGGRNRGVVHLLAELINVAPSLLCGSPHFCVPDISAKSGQILDRTHASSRSLRSLTGAFCLATAALLMGSGVVGLAGSSGGLPHDTQGCLGTGGGLGSAGRLGPATIASS